MCSRLSFEIPCGTRLPHFAARAALAQWGVSLMTLTARSTFYWTTSLAIYFLWLFSMLFSVTMESSAANLKNECFVGGGVGSLKCIEFLSAMNKFRQKGGNTSVAGVMETDAFGSYVLGFQTGFNMDSPRRLRHICATEWQYEYHDGLALILVSEEPNETIWIGCG